MARILIADDEAVIRMMFRAFLERDGFDVLEAANGNEALAVCRKERPDLIIIDLIMPDKEGIETIMELKQLYPDLKIIAISGGGRIRAGEYLTIAATFGVDQTLQKPIEREELLRVVRSLLPREGDPPEE